MNDVLIIGSGGHCRVVVSILRELGTENFRGILDLSLPNLGEKIMGVPVIGGVNILDDLEFKESVDIYLAIGSNAIRHHWYDKLVNNFCMPNLISPHAIVDKTVKLGLANIICAKAFIGPGVVADSNNLFNTGVIVDHEVIIGSHCHLAPASTICGRVVIGDNSFIGSGATILDGLTIASGTTVGGGALINKSLMLSNSTYVGIPGKIVDHG